MSKTALFLYGAVLLLICQAVNAQVPPQFGGVHTAAPGALPSHETAHGASRVFQGYSEFQIASAAFTVGGAMGLVPDAVIPPWEE